MDPDANLTEQREIAAAIMAIEDACDDSGHTLMDDQLSLEGFAFQLAELVQALDEWIVKGGYLPAAWGLRLSKPPACTNHPNRPAVAQRQWEPGGFVDPVCFACQQQIDGVDPA